MPPCRPAIEPPEENAKLLTVNAPAPYPPLCLPLALGTRVCVVRVDAMNVIIDTVSSVCSYKANPRHAEQRLQMAEAAGWQGLAVGMQPRGVGVDAICECEFVLGKVGGCYRDWRSAFRWSRCCQTTLGFTSCQAAVPAWPACTPSLWVAHVPPCHPRAGVPAGPTALHKLQP